MTSKTRQVITLLITSIKNGYLDEDIASEMVKWMWAEKPTLSGVLNKLEKLKNPQDKLMVWLCSVFYHPQARDITYPFDEPDEDSTSHMIYDSLLSESLALIITNRFSKKD